MGATPRPPSIVVAKIRSKRRGQRRALSEHQFADALARQRHHRRQLVVAEGMALRGALQFDEAAAVVAADAVPAAPDTEAAIGGAEEA